AAFFHSLQQGALRLGGGAVHFVNQHYLRKERSPMKDEALLGSIENGVAQDIGRQQVAGKLDALKSQRQRTSQGLGERGFPHAGNVFNQEVTTCQQTGDCEFYGLLFAHHNLADLPDKGFDLACHRETISDNKTVRKRDLGPSAAFLWQSS